MAELTVLVTMQVAGDLRVRCPTGQQVVDLVCKGPIFRMLAWCARDAKGVPLFEQCALDALFRSQPVQTRHVLSLAWCLARHGPDTLLKWCFGREAVKRRRRADRLGLAVAARPPASP